MKAFLNSQSGYCFLAWMLRNRTLSSRINRIHDRALRIVYRDKTPSFSELLQEDNAVIMHQMNSQVLIIEFYKVEIGIDLDLLKEIFLLSTHAFELRSSYEFKIENMMAVHYGTEYLSFVGLEIWEIKPLEIKYCQSLEEFKKKTKKIVLADSVKFTYVK